jgi:hypothetical protein
MEPHLFAARHYPGGGGDLEHHVEVQDTELEERAETITNLEQQLLEFQGQAPPESVNPEEIDAMSGIDED